MQALLLSFNFKKFYPLFFIFLFKKIDHDKNMVLKSMCGPYGFFLIFILLSNILQQTFKSKYKMHDSFLEKKCMIRIFDFVIFYNQYIYFWIF